MILLHTDPTLKTILPQGYINSVLKKNESLRELLAPSLYPRKKVIRINGKCKNNSNIFQLLSP